MLFSSRIPLSSLLTLCQSLRVGLSAGLPLVDVVKKQANKGPLAARPVLGRIAERLQEGESLEDVLKDEGRAFPPLFNGMVAVGEQTGNLPDVFRELEDYYRQMMTLKRQFWIAALWPIIQFVGAIFVITFMILILGAIAPTPESAYDPLGFGVGPQGAARFLGCVGILLGGLLAMYLFATRVLGQKAAVHRFLLRVPGLGGCLQALALARFSLAMHLTMDTSISTAKALKSCFRATGNGAYEACAEHVGGSLKKGKDVAETLTQCNIFPEEFLHVVATGEESGQLPEVMGQQAQHYQEVASLRMRVLTLFGNIMVWCFVAGLIIWAIFRMAMTYIGMIDNLADGKL
jgi:type IV pilus assembly protein PilC